ncbi:MAG TPA: twin-arginine translocase TatA/TatE family subunit [Acidimicrobiales bacterium]|nr:twin-arginine translocase TatA/TatE family subunit [Acidimicrobiales bacterium]
MLSLSPVKLLVVLVIALIVLGPEKLPQVARQLGAAWGDLRRFRTRLESDVRGAFPDLPPAHEVAQAVRSPLAFLDRLADEHERSRDTAVDGNGSETPGVPVATGPPPSTAGNGTGVHDDGGGAVTTTGERANAPEPTGPYHVPLDDPSMN